MTTNEKEAFEQLLKANSQTCVALAKLTKDLVEVVDNIKTKMERTKVLIVDDHERKNS
jgi:hypothetical protein